MSQNLTPIFCNLADSTLFIGGTVVNGIAILYSIGSISTSLMEYIKIMPKLIDDPKSVLVTDSKEWP